MARSTDDEIKITTKNGRLKLAARHRPYWRTIEGGAALGYRKGVRGGVWTARFTDPTAGGGYRLKSLGKADDELLADGVKVLSFQQADRRARDWIARRRRVLAGLQTEEPEAPAKSYTVAEAIADYLADLEGRSGKSVVRTKLAAHAHIIPALGNVPLPHLTRKKITEWLHALAKSPPRLRSKAGFTRTRDVDAEDHDAQRRRRSSANRILTILKAALNHARAIEKFKGSDDAWALVKPFKEADSPKVRYLSDDECKRLVEACPPDLKDLVVAALFTGCRYGELASLRASDFDQNASTIWIAKSKSGKARHVKVHAQARDFFIRKVAGLSAKARIFTHSVQVAQAGKDQPAEMRRVPWGQAHQFRPVRRASEAAGIVPAASFHVLRHSYASRLARSGTSLQIIAKLLGHADTRITERHYAHLALSEPV